MRGRRASRRLRGDHGASMVEMALVMPILALFIFGIITFGVLLSFKQTMTQSAAEGARAAATAPRSPTDQVVPRAEAATAQAVGGFDRTCNGSDGLTCDYDIATCTDTPTADCITVELTYDYDGHPLLPKLPIIASFVPDTIKTRSVVQINAVTP
ncbi:hypothetical protein BH20ACT2_BH20ACT2_07490 [soil metagenome]